MSSQYYKQSHQPRSEIVVGLSNWLLVRLTYHPWVTTVRSACDVFTNGAQIFGVLNDGEVIRDLQGDWVDWLAKVV
jgi:hypothetical protein